MLRAELGGDVVSHSRIRRFADAADINYFTLRKLVKGHTPTPAYATIEKLRVYYERRFEKRLVGGG